LFLQEQIKDIIIIFAFFWPSGRRGGTQKIRNKKLSIALEVLSDIKHVLQEDAGLTLNFDSTQKSKTKLKKLCSLMRN